MGWMAAMSSQSFCSLWLCIVLKAASVLAALISKLQGYPFAQPQRTAAVTQLVCVYMRLMTQFAAWTWSFELCTVAVLERHCNCPPNFLRAIANGQGL